MNKKFEKFMIAFQHFFLRHPFLQLRKSYRRWIVNRMYKKLNWIRKMSGMLIGECSWIHTNRFDQVCKQIDILSETVIAEIFNQLID